MNTKTSVNVKRMNTGAVLMLMSLFLACSTSPQTEANPPTSQSESPAMPEETTESKPSADYSSLFLNYQCDLTLEEVAEILELPIADLKMEPSLNTGAACIVSYSRNGTYECELSWGKAPSTQSGNKKAIAKALRDKEKGSSPYTDITLSEAGDCYLQHIPMRGRIQIRNEDQEGSFGLIYGNRGKRSDEQHAEMRAKMTRMANYLLEKHRK